MRKALKFIIIGLISFFVILAVAVGILMAVVNPNRFKPAITMAADQATGRQLDLKGNISWTIYPNLGIKIEDVALSNPKEFSNSKFLQLKSANIAVELIPLMSHKVIFKALDIDGLNVALLKKGTKNNWTFTQSTPTNPTAGTPKKQNVQLSINAFSLTNSSILYTDLDKKTTTGLKNINFKIDSGFDGGINLDTKADTLTLHKLKLNYNEQVIGNINFDVTDLDNPKYNGNIDFVTLKINDLQKQFTKSSAKSMPIMDNLALKAQIDGDTNNVKVSHIKFNANNIVKGLMNVNIANLKNPNINGDINLPSIDVNKVMVGVGSSPIDLANKDLLTHVSFKSNFSGTLKNINLTSLILKAADTTVTGNANITSFSPINVIENINVDHFDVANISDINGFKVPLNQIHLSGNANLGNNGINSLSGKQNVTIANITLIGFDLTKQIKSANNILTGGGKNKDVLSQAANSAQLNQEINSVKASVQTAMKPGPKNPLLKSNLGNFVMHANFNRGIASPSNFSLNGPDLNINGNGSVNIPAKALNYKVGGKIITQGIDPLFQHLTVDANATGTFKKPSINLDWNSLIKQIITYTLQNSGAIIKKAVDQQIKKSVDDSINKAIGNAINNLFHKPAQ